MNRNETKLLVENWRKVLKNGLANTENDLLEESKVGKILSALVLGATFLGSPGVGNALDPLEVEKGMKKAFSEKGMNIQTKASTDEITISYNGKSKTYSMPDTSNYEGSHFNSWLKSRIKSVADWKRFLEESGSLDAGSENLFLSSPQGWSGASYQKDLTNSNESLLNDLNNLCEMSRSEIFKMADGELILVGYTDDNMPITWVYWDKNKLEEAVKFMQGKNNKLGKQGKLRNAFNDLRKVLRKI